MRMNHSSSKRGKQKENADELAKKKQRGLINGFRNTKFFNHTRYHPVKLTFF